jgi:bloom syndrome protein
MTHLQEMKDELLAVANELLDDDGELNPQHSQELHKRRFHPLSLINITCYF